MRLKLYCNRYKHFKDALVCSVGCAYRARCKDFALFYDQNRDETDKLVDEYYTVRRAAEAPPPTGGGKPRKSSAEVSRGVEPVRIAPYQKVAKVADLRSLVHLEVKRVMSEATYIWIGKDDQAEVLEHEEVIRRAERGAKPKSIFRVAQEMELRFQLVPRRGIDKAKRAVAVEAERAAERLAARRSRPRLVNHEVEGTSAAPRVADEAQPAPPLTRRPRTPRIAKAVGEK